MLYSTNITFIYNVSKENVLCGHKIKPFIIKYKNKHYR